MFLEVPKLAYRHPLARTPMEWSLPSSERFLLNMGGVLALTCSRLSSTGEGLDNAKNLWTGQDYSMQLYIAS